MVKKTDVLIVGGGVIGIASAYYLLKAGASVTIVEKSEVGLGSSYGNAGWIVPSYSIPLASPHALSNGLKWLLDPESPFYIKPRFSLDMATWLWKFRAASNKSRVRKAIPILRDLNRASLLLFDEIIAGEHLDCHYQRHGVLTLFISKGDLRAGEEEASLLQKFGLDVEVIGAHEIQGKVPTTSSAVVGGMYSSEDAHLNPARFVGGLAGKVQEMGAKIVTDDPVIGLDAGGGKVMSAQTRSGRFQADVFVLAAGAWSEPIARRLGLRLGIQPAKGYSITVERPQGFPELPLMLGGSKVAVTPLEGMLRFAGTLELSGFDMNINRKRVGAILSAVEKYLRFHPSELPVPERWAGLRPCTPDGLPSVGWARGFNNLMVASGHCMLGVSLGPVTGKLVAQLATGATPDFDLSLLNPGRFS